MRQTARFGVNSIMVNHFASLFNCTPGVGGGGERRGRASDVMQTHLSSTHLCSAQCCILIDMFSVLMH